MRTSILDDSTIIRKQNDVKFVYGKLARLRAKAHDRLDK